MRNFMEKPETADFFNTLGVKGSKITIDELLLLQNIQQDLKEAYLFKDPADGLHKIFCYKVECLGPLGPDEKHQVDKLYARYFLTEEAAVRYLAKEFPNSERKLFHTYMVSKTLDSRMIECINILSSTDFAGLISLLSISNEQ